MADPAAELATLVRWGLDNEMAVGELHGLRSALHVGPCDSLEVIAERIREAFAEARDQPAPASDGRNAVERAARNLIGIPDWL